MTRLILGPMIGGLATNRANLWGRADGPGMLHAWIGKNPDLSDAQLTGKSLPLAAENGYAGVAPVGDLLPNTRYHYALTFSDSPPIPQAGAYPSFTTFPASGERQSFVFAFGSCFRPADQNGGQIFTALNAVCQRENIRFLLMIGDQIYADAYEYNGIGKIACTLQEYREVYAYTWSRPHLRSLLANMPVYMTLDDHEVDDDWRWLDSQRLWATIPWWDKLIRWWQHRPPQERNLPLKRVQDALQAYWEHQGMHAPAMHTPPTLDLAGQYTLEASQPGSLAYTFNFGAAAFFVLDTRTMRVCNRQERIMLGNDQWQALENWLLLVKHAYPVKFLVTSCALLYNMWLDIPRDRWSGFLEERNRLLHFLATNDIQGVYLLAGDLHSAHAIRADLYTPQGRDLPLWEFCSSPFEQDPEKYTRLTYSPLRNGLIKKQERYFTVQEHNFGLVRVDFSTDQPRVAFEVYGSQGDVLASVQA